MFQKLFILWKLYSDLLIPTYPLMANLHPRRRNLSDSEPVVSALQFEAVEPRVLFSATAIDPVEPQVSGHHELPQVQEEIVLEVSTPSQSDAESGPHAAEDQIIGGLNYRAADLDATERRELVFVSSGLFDDGYLAQHLDPAYEVYLIEPGSDAIQQIASVLEGRSGIDAIHLIGHGEEGRLFLGETALDAESMAGEHGAILERIGASLSDQADLLIYGCDFTTGENGVAAASLLSSLTGADVAASDDKTGHADLGGDWELETATGEIESTSIALGDWRGTLAATDLAAQPNSMVLYDAGNNILNEGDTVGAGGRAVWVNAGTVGGQAIDLVAYVVSVGTGDSVQFENPLAGTDDPSFVLNSGGTNQAGEAVIEWSIVLTGTTIPAYGDITFTIADIDGIGGNPNTRETVIPSLNGLTAYGANNPTNIQFAVSSGAVSASGTQNQNTGGGQAEPEAAALFTWQNVSSWQITYQLAANNLTGAARFAHDGDGDFVFSNLESIQLLGVDLDDNNSTQTGADHWTRFTEGGAPVSISDTDTTITQNVALGTDLTGATVTLTNAQAGDELLVNGLPDLTGTISGVNYTITSGGGTITIDFDGVVSVSTYESILESVTFRNTQTGISAVDRVLEVTVYNSAFGTTSNTAISTIEINRPPVANPASTPTGFETPVIVNLLGNDTDADNDAISIVGTPTVANPAHGSLAFVGGNWVFTPANGFSGTAVINYTIQDIHGATDTGTHDVVVENAPPVLEDPDLTPGTPYVNPLDATNLIVPAVDNVFVSLDLDNYFTDANNDTLAYTPNMTGVPLWLTYNATTHVLSGTPPVDNTGSVTVPVLVSDGNGGTLNASITINPVNPGPTANFQSVSTGFETPVIVDLLGNDTDPDGDPLTIQGTPTVANPAHGTLALVGANWVFTPANGFSGTATINYTIVDQDGATSSSTHAVVVENAPPVLVDPDLTPGTPFVNPLDATNLIVPAVDNVLVSVDLDSYIVDPNGHTLTFSPDLPSLPVWLTYNATTHVLSGTPPVDNVGPVTIPLTVTDGNGGTFTGSITINPVNPGPTANFQSVSTAFETPVIVDLLGNDTDPDGDPLTIQGTPTVADPAHGTLALVGGNWVFTPANGFSGAATINYSIVDQDGATSSSTHQVVVANAVPTLVDPDPTPGSPYINPLDPDDLIVPAVDNVPIAIDLDNYFEDLNGDLLTITPNLAGLPGWLSYDAGTGVLSGTPPIDNQGSVVVPVTVTDGNGGTFTGTITIDPVNPGPVAADDQYAVLNTTPVVVVGNALDNDSDPDGDPLTAVVETDVAGSNGGLFSIAANGEVTFNPDGAFDDLLGGESRTTSFTYTLVDADGESTTATVTVTVSGENAPPNPNSGAITVNVGSRGGNLGLTAPTDPDGDPLTITVKKLPRVGTLRLSNGTPVTVGQVLTARQLEKLVFDAPADYKGNRPVKFLYTVSDGQYVATAKVDISIVKGRSCFVSMPATFKNGGKKAKD